MKDSGFTFIEIILVVFISGIVITALTRLIGIGFPTSKTTYAQGQANETARLQLKRVSGALRELRIAETGAYAVAEAGAQRLIFYSDVNGDGLAERLRYELNGTDLERGVVVPSGDPMTYNLANEKVSVVSAYIQNGVDPVFVYYDGDYPSINNPLTSPVDETEVKYIEFFLNIDVDTGIDPPPVEIRSQVNLRNLKTNLGEVVGS